MDFLGAELVEHDLINTTQSTSRKMMKYYALAKICIQLLRDSLSTKQRLKQVQLI